MTRNDVISYLNSALQRPARINKEDIAVLCTVIEDENGKVYKVQDVINAASADPFRMMRYIEAMWNFLIKKYSVLVQTEVETMGTFISNSQIKVIKYL